MNAQVVPRFEKDLRQLNFPANVKEVLGKLGMVLLVLQAFT